MDVLVDGMSKRSFGLVILDRYLASKAVEGIESRYIIHDAAAKEVDRHNFSFPESVYNDQLCL